MSEISVHPRKTSCPTCGDKAQAVIDYSLGDLICTGCGLVLEGQCIDDAAEWRTFASEGVDNGPQGGGAERADKFGGRDMNSDEADGTSITGSSALAKTLQKAQTFSDRFASSGPRSAAKQEEKNLKLFTMKIQEITSRLGLSGGIVNRCVALFQDLSSKNELKQRNQVSWHCAVVHIASMQERATRTIRELAEANAGSAGKKELEFEKQIDKRVKQINKALGLVQPAAYVEDQELMARFVNRLQLAPQVCKPASFISKEAYKYGLVGRQPQTAIVASAIFLVAWMLNVEEKPKFGDVAAIARVSEASVRAAYKHMRSSIRRLVPQDFVCRLPGGIDGLPS